MRHHGDNGQGLAISRRPTGLIGGRFRLGSTAVQGSNFWVDPAPAPRPTAAPSTSC